jgi:hypothetical protein
MNYQNFSIKNQTRRSKPTMLERAMHGPIKARRENAVGSQNYTLGTSQIRNKSSKPNDISFNSHQKRKSNESESKRSNSIRRNLVNSQDKTRTGQFSKINNCLTSKSKNLSIGDLKYEALNYETATSKHAHKNTLQLANKYISLPGSVKHTSNPSYTKITNVPSSTKASSKLKININQASYIMKDRYVANSNKSQANIQPKPNTYYKRTHKTGVSINIQNEGLDDKYLQSSLDHLNQDSNRKWEEGQEQLQQMTSGTL